MSTGQPAGSGVTLDPLNDVRHADVAVVACCSPEPPGNGIDLMVNALEIGKVIGTAMANYVVGSRDGEGHQRISGVDEECDVTHGDL